MAFELLVRPRGKPGNKGVVSVQKGPTNITFAFGEDLCVALGWKASARVNMYLGIGADAGKIRFIGEPKGEYQLSHLSQNSKTLKLSRRMVPGFPEGKFSRAVMDHVRVDSGIEATLPTPGSLKPLNPSFKKGLEPIVAPVVSAPKSIFAAPPPMKPEQPEPATNATYNRRCTICSKVFPTDNLRRTNCQSCSPGR